MNIALKNLDLEGTTIVRTRDEARHVVSVLRQYPERIAAWDTETIGIDPKIESPVGKGQVICASAFLGPDVDFGNGPRLLIDNFADAEGILLELKDYFEDPNYLKCWHNYGYDRHILYNHGIDCRGFGGDTMHMARLFDPSLMPGSYSLESQSELLQAEIEETKSEMITHLREKGSPTQVACLDTYERVFRKTTKINVKETFGFYKQLKNGETGKILMFPDIEEMHTDERYVEKWVEYSCFDAEITYFLRETLAKKLCQLESHEEGMSNLLDLYAKYWLPFGEVLTDMERNGIAVDVNYLKQI